MKINEKQLAFILGISQRNAKIKILRAKGREMVKAGEKLEHPLELDHGYYTTVEIESSVITDYEGVDIDFAIKDIYENALKRPGYRKYLLYEYPVSKMDKKDPTRIISLPVALKSMLSDESVETIKEYWEKNLSSFVSDKWPISLNYKPIFKP